MKKPEEIKKGLAIPVPVHYHVGDFEPHLTHLNFLELECLHVDAIAYIQQLESRVPRWIPVEERLPEEGTYVIVAASDVGGLYTTEATLERGKWVVETDCVHGDLCANNVTHWTHRLNHPLEEVRHD